MQIQSILLPVKNMRDTHWSVPQKNDRNILIKVPIINFQFRFVTIYKFTPFLNQNLVEYKHEKSVYAENMNAPKIVFYGKYVTMV